jgi:hypothetical protein
MEKKKHKDGGKNNEELIICIFVRCRHRLDM